VPPWRSLETAPRWSAPIRRRLSGAAKLHEAQIVALVDDAEKYGVLRIDTHRMEMPAVSGDFAVGAR